MVRILQDKAVTTKFQILIEIAAARLNIQQKDIANKLNVTPQAISLYIEELVKDHLVVSGGRSKYRVTKEGIDWVLKMFRELQRYSTFVEKAVTNIAVCAAVADSELSRDQVVGLKMKDGLLFTTDAIDNGARGVVISDAKKGEDVGLYKIEGIVPLEIGEITVLKVPGIQRGGSKSVDLTRLKEKTSKTGLVGVIGIEASVALKKVGIAPHYSYGVKEALVEAAYSGLSSVAVCVDDEIPELLQRLGEEHLQYQILDMTKVGSGNRKQLP